VTCAKPGFQTATIAQSPHFVGTTFGNIVAGGLVGVAVDAATGANYQYPDTIRIPLSPVKLPPVEEGKPAPVPSATSAAESGS
jgi:hypothetical protein